MSAAFGPTPTPRVRGLLDAEASSFAEHQDCVGPLPQIAPQAMLQLLADSGLTGRGGGSFPTHRKLAIVARTPSALVVGNAAEGEPASSKDRFLLSVAPHLVLDGLELARRVVGARVGCMAAPADLLDSVLSDAVAQRRTPVRLVAVPEGFVSGQETAVVAAAEGRSARPVMLTALLAEHGVSGRPAVVLNAETLAHIALIARYGAGWFRSRGVPEDPGSRLITISGAVRWPGVWEARGGSTLDQLISAAGGPTEPLSTLLVGGYHGAWVPWDQEAAGRPFTRQGLQRYDAGPGAGVVIAVSARRCGLRAAAGVVAYLAGETAGQCGPCLHGLPEVARQLQALAALRGTRRTLDELYRLSDLVEGRGACRHPDGTARFVRSTLAAFEEEARHHLAGRCTAQDEPPTQQQGREPWLWS